jgi:hypothetical protein
MRLSKTSLADAFRGEYRAEERRGSHRFPLDEEVRYKCLVDGVATSGTGRTVNIGSGGVVFTTGERLPEGAKVEMAINWPVALDGGCPLQFVATGVVLRSNRKNAAVRIDRYEFHTRATRSN